MNTPAPIYNEPCGPRQQSSGCLQSISQLWGAFAVDTYQTMTQSEIYDPFVAHSVHLWGISQSCLGSSASSYPLLKRCIFMWKKKQQEYLALKILYCSVNLSVLSAVKVFCHCTPSTHLFADSIHKPYFIYFHGLKGFFYAPWGNTNKIGVFSKNGSRYSGSYKNRWRKPMHIFQHILTMGSHWVTTDTDVALWVE